MKNIIFLVLIIALFTSCVGQKEDYVKQVDWGKRTSEVRSFDNYFQGKTYLPIYSHIYHIHELRTFDLTITVSIRNVSVSDSIHILKADYYNTQGNKIREYIKNPVFLKPLETIEIIIKEKDNEGGSGANFIFDWAVKNSNNPPLFEAIMISTYNQQGLSYSTRGVQITE
jgi:hypothetical protein